MDSWISLTRFASGVFAYALLLSASSESARGASPCFSRISNGGFERGTEGWTVSGSAALDETARAGGAKSLKIESGAVSQEIPGLPAGLLYTIALSWKIDSVAPEKDGEKGYAFLAVYQIDEFGEIAAFKDFVQGTGSRDWIRAEYTFTVEAETALVSVRAGIFRARGTLWIDNVTLAPGRAALEFSEGIEGGRIPSEARGSEPGLRGSAAILDDRFPPLPKEGPGAGIASDPARLEKALRAAGFGAARIDGAAISDPRILDRSRFDVLILPWGPQFPAPGAASLRRFLRSGGKLVTLGGYAFDSLLIQGEDGWAPYAPPAPRGPGDARWHCELDAAGLRDREPLTYSAWTRTQSIAGAMFAFLAVYQYAADGRLVTFHDLTKLKGTRPWERWSWTFRVDPQAARVDLMAGILDCRGAAWFDEIELTDRSGAAIAGDPTETDFDPDLKAPGKWWRNDRELLAIDGAAAHAGKRSLKARLRGAPAAIRINTRTGQPGDGLHVEPDQLGMFDPDRPLERAVGAAAAPDQEIFPEDYRLEGPLQGWCATGVTGGNAARWIPLLDACDRYGRPRGAAGAMLRFYGGPFAGSSWAFFGLTNRDPFEGPGGEEAFGKLIESLADDVYLAWIKAEPPCVRPGEAVLLKILARNGGKKPRKVRVAIEAAPLKGAAAFRAEKILDLDPGGSGEISFEWRPGPGAADFFVVQARAGIIAGTVERKADAIEGGLVVWNEKLVKGGPALGFKDNYLSIGGRPFILFGTDDYGHVFNSDRETPLQWLRDMEKRRDFGITIYENLQVGYIHETLDKVPAGGSARERFFKQCDGIVQLTQAYGQVYFPCLLCGYDVAVDDAALEAHAGFAREYARRYGAVPGLIYYLNGDLRCRPSDAVKPQWNAFLKERYGTTEGLRSAWGPLAPQEELGSVPVEDYSDRGRAWEDVKAYDYNRFRAHLIRRWTGRLIAAIREADSSHPTTCEFYQLPHEGVDIPAAIGDLDISNIGYFDRPGADIRRFPSVLLLSDQRWRGTSMGPGEYGVKTHPAWGDGRDHGYHIARTRTQAIDLFLAAAHYTLGLGGSRLHNWCWKDGAEWIFPWGLVGAPDGVEKDTLRVLRNQSLLFRHLAPVYRPPRACVLTPDSHRLGGAKWEVTEGILSSISLLLAAHIELGVLNEDSLVPERGPGGKAAGIPPRTVVLFYPLPFTPPDPACEELLRWVKGGGILYLSGDISFDELRKRTRTARLEELCGVRFRGEIYKGLAAGKEAVKRISRNRTGESTAWTGAPSISVEPAGAEAMAWTEGGEPVVFRHRLGKGWVVFSTDPLELRPTAENRPFHLELYRDVLSLAHVPPFPLEPDLPDLHFFLVPLRDAGRAFVLFNGREGKEAARVTFGGDRPIALEVAPGRPALVWLDGDKRLRAIEARSAAISGKPVLEDSTGGSVLSLDGRDLRESRSLLFMPLEAGKFRMHTDSAWKGLAGEVGEISGGKWLTYEPAQAEVAVGEIRIEVTSDQALSLILLAEPETLETARAAVEKAILRPEDLK